MLALLLLALPQQPQPVPADLAADVARSERIGLEIFLNDRASSRATDCLAAKLGTLEDKGLGGFLAVRETEEGGKPAPSWVVSFVSDEDPPRVLHRVRVALEERPPVYLDTPEPLALPDTLRTLFAARQLAIEKGGPYEQPVNPVVLRGADVGAEGILVYLLAGSDTPDVAVLGRHVRVRVSEDGQKVLEVAPLTKSVIESPTKTAEGKPVVALTVTQLLTDFPTEAHVFANLLYKLPVGVGTKRGVWMVEEGKIRFLGERAPPKAKLALKLRERATGEPREGQVQLYRVGIPAEKGWTAGDERAGQFHVPKEGLEIPDLPPGRYRAACNAHACTAPDLPEFELKSPRSEVGLELDAPQEREVWVEVFDARGKLFEKAEYLPGSRDGSVRLPGWLHLRAEISADGSVLPAGMAGGMLSHSSDQGWRKLQHGAHGFSLGREREDGGLYRTTRSIQLRVPDHGTVFGSVTFDGHEELRYRTLLFEKGSLEGLFKLPDGSEVDLERVRVETPLEPDLLPRPPEFWLDVPIRISVNVPGFRRLEFEQRLRDGLPRPRTLEKAP